MKAVINSDNIPKLEIIYGKIIENFLKENKLFLEENYLSGLNIHNDNTIFFREIFGTALGEDFLGKPTNFNMDTNIDGNCFIISGDSPNLKGKVTISSHLIFKLGIELLNYMNENENKYNLKDLYPIGDK